MKGIFKHLAIIVFSLVAFPTLLVYPEGTEQIMPNLQSKGQLCINKYRNDFAFYDAKPEFRLNISIANPSETIRFGFGKVLSSDPSILYYRIKDPSGTTVYGPFAVPSSGAGFINSYPEAVAGPFPAGYNYLEIIPLTSGDYFMEFSYSNITSDNNRHYLEFFDITVVNTAGNAMNGRIWSKAWQFWSGGDAYSSYERFYGKMMVLSDDSIVTQVDCNGFRGGSFSFSSNMTGCSTTGNLSNDRMSRRDFYTYPQYKVFLNDPDSNLYPTQKVTSGIILPVIVTTDCTTGGADFGVKVEKDGTVKLLLEINSSPGADPEDVQLIASVKADPGGSGYNIISWNGNDNLGRPVASGTSLSFTVTNLSGLTHLPIYDIENNDNGIIVKQIRPAGSQLKIYWDDTQIGGTSNTSTGCLNAGGCHTWNNDFGNNNTINSWWFVTGTETSATSFITKKLPGPPAISGSNLHCMGSGNLEFSITSEPNSTSYKWSYSGTGVTMDATGVIARLQFSKDATPGVLSVQGHNDICGNGPESSMDIVFEPLPDVALIPFPDMCYTAPGFKLSGGQPEGGLYSFDGVLTDSIYPYKEPEGLHSISYTYTSPLGCSNSDTTGILLRKGPDCEGTVFFPGAFSPNRDSLNDTFKPVVDNIYSFKMYIFDRWGQLIYSTQDVAKGWDGKSMGAECPIGVYTYIAKYAQSLRKNEEKTIRGVFELIR